MTPDRRLHSARCVAKRRPCGADINDDGLPDIAVANVDADVISVFAGRAAPPK